MALLPHNSGMARCFQHPVTPNHHLLLRSKAMASPKLHLDSDSRKPLTHERLLELLSYDPITGVFQWRPGIKRRNPYSGRAGAGCIDTSGYIVIRIDYQLYYGHRLAWFYINGEWPEGLIDHRNRDRADNSWANLRLATDKQNTFNRGPDKRNQSGFKGVCRSMSGKWRATINNRHLGVFSTPEEAFAAYEKAAIELHGEYAGIA